MYLLNFEMPKSVVVDKKTQTEKYAKMDVRPLERGWGHTLGNALRRVLLNSLEGAAITTVRIEGVNHEFSTVEGVYEDVTHIILNLKKVLFKVVTRKPFTCTLKVSGKGDVTAKDIKVPAGVEILNPDHYICNLDENGVLGVEMKVEVGRRYRPADLNKSDKLPVGVIPIDSSFSPIEKVKYAVDSARVGNQTDYDALTLEVWTDGRIGPVEAVIQAAELLREHINFFATIGDPGYLEGEPGDEGESELGYGDSESFPGVSPAIQKILKANAIFSLRELSNKTEAEVKVIDGLSPEALTEIKAALKNNGLTFVQVFKKKADEQ